MARQSTNCDLSEISYLCTGNHIQRLDFRLSFRMLHRLTELKKADVHISFFNFLE